MPKIGYAETQIGTQQNTTPIISVDESIGGLLFDISGFDNPFGKFPLIQSNFGSNQICLINNLEEAAQFGIEDNDFMSGLVYYHLSMFYDYVGENAPLYVAFANCSEDWDFIGTMQRMVNGKMFQLGVWTSQPIWTINSENNIVFTSLIPKIEAQVEEELTGKLGQPSPSPIPLSVILSANTYVENVPNLKKLPNALSFEAPKVSVLLCQNKTKEVLDIQTQMPQNTPVGSLGFIMAILNLAGAEESIGAVAKYNLNKNDNFQYPEIAIGNSHFLLDSINRITLNIVASYGYIVPVNYESKAGECFYNGDTSLNTGDYGTISNNRIIHKCRRAIVSALLPFLNGNELYDNALRGLSNNATQALQEAIGGALSGTLVNKEGQYQINSYQITVIDSQNILDDDTVSINYNIIPINYNETLTDNVIVKE